MSILPHKIQDAIDSNEFTATRDPIASFANDAVVRLASRAADEGSVPDNRENAPSSYTNGRVSRTATARNLALTATVVAFLGSAAAYAASTTITAATPAPETVTLTGDKEVGRLASISLSALPKGSGSDPSLSGTGLAAFPARWSLYLDRTHCRRAVPLRD